MAKRAQSAVEFVDVDVGMPAINFSVSCVPPTVTAQQKGVMVRGGRARFFTKAAAKEAENTLWAMVSPHRPVAPFAGPLRVVITWTFPWRAGDLKSDGVTKKKRLEGIPWTPCDRRPDVDNLVKAFLDVLCRARFYEDDSQVASLLLMKGWGDEPGIRVHLSEWSIFTAWKEIAAA
jgi:Holliday junction resolvase RusA-like endonuclease